MKIGITIDKFDAYELKAELLPFIISQSKRSYLLEIDRETFIKHKVVLASVHNAEKAKQFGEVIAERSKRRREAMKENLKNNKATKSAKPKKPCGGCSRGRGDSSRVGKKIR